MATALRRSNAALGMPASVPEPPLSGTALLHMSLNRYRFKDIQQIEVLPRPLRVRYDRAAGSIHETKAREVMGAEVSSGP